ncbi:MAG: hypothetical protein F4Y82_06675 [Cenarchaeum sp. SB0665_bin_23]|nr:hypothetical protein [Cenarchaeum sp. SB0667_bin_13]MXY61775.1 hypothetical protein [Cenarchaeum sp. SB0665_bin_23]MXZ93505.1 hypothetical protein [Cenarchaeum sp. SB0666_bin_15]MYB46364.1 hypothetical protein [Cenarchaeum sp. SB0662_bin_33]MYC79855.1 hypothetical protein [Cenarchaeum sp. SB0661_bin_35]MYD58409.1 hypothetical protein [Cenarchaeum sp. SB0678_bin_8]MYG33489.1 hypothetical protein [Cenarchaeum sp. SB0677_bin_16]MYI51933.1 hypothetical protein [Cenarchaeum sp. SB0673_bin_9]M
MKEIGKVLHQAGSGRVIIRLHNDALEGDVLYDSKGVRVARIREIIGPVTAPYASAEPITNNIRRHIGELVGTHSKRTKN